MFSRLLSAPCRPVAAGPRTTVRGTVNRRQTPPGSSSRVVRSKWTKPVDTVRRGRCQPSRTEVPLRGRGPACRSDDVRRGIGEIGSRKARIGARAARGSNRRIRTWDCCRFPMPERRPACRSPRSLLERNRNPNQGQQTGSVLGALLLDLASFQESAYRLWRQQRPNCSRRALGLL